MPLARRSCFSTHTLPLIQVFFANERTCACALPDPSSLPATWLTCAMLSTCSVLSWLNFTVTLSALAAGLLNFGDQVGRISAAMFSFVGECAGELGCGRRKRRKEAGADCTLEELACGATGARVYARRRGLVT